MLMLKTRRGSLKADDIFDFLSTIVDKCIERNIQKALILIDNAPAHSKAEKQLAEKLQNVNSAAFESIELLRLSPYSPALNPIENYWSKFKGKVKDEMRRRRVEICNNDVGRQAGESLLNKRLRIMEEIAHQAAEETSSVSDISHYFNHVHFFHLPRAANDGVMLIGE